MRGNWKLYFFLAQKLYFSCIPVKKFILNLILEKVKEKEKENLYQIKLITRVFNFYWDFLHEKLFFKFDFVFFHYINEIY